MSTCVVRPLSIYQVSVERVKPPRGDGIPRLMGWVWVCDANAITSQLAVYCDCDPLPHPLGFTEWNPN